MKTIVLFGFSANPPHFGHKKMIEILSGCSDLVFVVPCGERADKSYGVESKHRFNMTKIIYEKIVSGGFKNVILSDEDVFRKEYIKTWELFLRYKENFPNDKIVIAIGSDLLSDIREKWVYGKELWTKADFAIFVRDRGHIKEKEFPLKRDILLYSFDALKFSSTLARKKLADGENVRDILPKEISDYIKDNNLY